MHRLSLLLLLITSFSVTSHATTILVPADQPTIQEGLDTAVAGDTVLVSAGTYHETINWPAVNGITLIGSSAADCIIDGFALFASVILFAEELGGIITSSTSITGFTLINGTDPEDGLGGGICLHSSSPRLSAMTIRDNTAAYGAGIYCSNSDLSMSNLTIINNSAEINGGGIACVASSPTLSDLSVNGNGARNGAGIHLSDNSGPTITNSNINGNSANGYGGGFCSDSSYASLNNLTIISNSALESESGYGGGIYCSFSDISVVDATIIGNAAELDGGGIACFNSSPILEDLTISGNAARYGAGIHLSDYSSPTITNSTISDNSAHAFGGGLSCYDDASPYLENVTISDNYAHLDGGGVFCSWWSIPQLVNVEIFNNEGDDEGGGVFCSWYSGMDLFNVRITDNIANSGGGLSCAWHVNLILEDVLIQENSATTGGGIWSRTSSVSLTQVLVTENYASNGAGLFTDESDLELNYVTLTGNTATTSGGGLFCDESSPNLTNCILWHNAPQEVFFSDFWGASDITVACSDLEGGEAGIATNDNGTVFWLDNNLEEDPLFCDPVVGDYFLALESPCRSDSCGYMGYSDEPCIGFGESVFENRELPATAGLIRNYPNPFNPTTSIDYHLTAASQVVISIYNINGQRVELLENGFFAAGYYTVQWQPAGLSSGIYFAQLQAGELRDVMKVSYIR
ncbi:MAG: right-handed parallel beta-helix repeat-containing protein [Candidatus Delongbacteria bacterium]|nr:right-handed parallel beta-helix repeat-containing protein [Candidatus Delongbacteria bacterium]